jgi:hypothetical protein
MKLSGLFLLLLLSCGCGKNKILSEETYSGKLIVSNYDKGVTFRDTSDLAITVKMSQDSIFFECENIELTTHLLKRDDQSYTYNVHRGYRTYRLKNDSLFASYDISDPSAAVFLGNFEGKKN